MKSGAVGACEDESESPVPRPSATRDATGERGVENGAILRYPRAKKNIELGDLRRTKKTQATNRKVQGQLRKDKGESSLMLQQGLETAILSATGN